MLIAVFATIGIAIASFFQTTVATSAPPAMQVAMVIVPMLLIFPVIGICYVAFHAVFLREAIGHLSLAHIDFDFTARTKHWLGLLLGDAALLVGTLGFGYVFLSYRHWKFLITHLEAGGEVDFATLTQSTTSEPKQGEGLLDAFDVGAF